MAPMKRQRAASPAPARGKKARGVDVSAQCKDIAAALKNATDLPHEVRSMLSSSAFLALSVVKEERHASQERIVTWIGDALAGIEAALEKASGEAKAKVQGADAEKASREAALNAAKESLESLKTAASEAHAKSSELEKAHKEATKEHSDAKAAQKSGDVEDDGVATLRADLGMAMDYKYTPLKAGSAAQASVAALLKDLKTVLSKTKLDAEFLRCLPNALGKEPSKRSTFDVMVMNQAEEDIKKQLAELGEAFAATVSRKEARASAVAGAEAKAAAATEQDAAGKKASAEASAAQKQGETAVKDATKACKDLGPQTKAAEGAAKAGDKELVSFRSLLEVFRSLRDRTTPPPVEEPVEEAAAAPEAEAEAAAAAPAEPAAPAAPVAAEA